MGNHSYFGPSRGATDEWYTPRYIFDALGCDFDLDVAAPLSGPRHVPARAWLHAGADGLRHAWTGFVWMNPPFGGRNGLVPWLNRFFEHGNGIALTPDRTSAPWWQDAALRADAMVLIRGKTRFERPDGSIGKSPGDGVTLWAAGSRATEILTAAGERLGCAWVRAGVRADQGEV
ncbi:adenine methyltransferase [Sinirhodobacter populi]|uniref:Adenine methyltransferase n=1 Tax=Paenirhodobacter populi TaxID=2306993 RepID=A0A443KCR5_9RHOB|nr:DNA N-6-adenine-methyltransferase [Sinirhodobacter populi]RWR30486.1 adenine methyltransferase [Sinirhodobacter populi]